MAAERIFFQDIMVVDVESEVEFGHYFEDVEARRTCAYHEAGTPFVELSYPKNETIRSKDDLLPVLQFASPDIAEEYCTAAHVTYRQWFSHGNDAETPTEELLRKIRIGTHLPIFVKSVKMQQQHYNRIELDHVDSRFNTYFTIPPSNKALAQGKTFKDLYSQDREKFSWIRAGAGGVDAAEAAAAEN